MTLVWPTHRLPDDGIHQDDDLTLLDNTRPSEDDDHSERKRTRVDGVEGRISGKHSRTASAWGVMLYPSTPCGRATPKTALWSFQV
jgi:hypothetical protein